MSVVYEDDFGVTHCGDCDAELLCDENGDMPDVCHKCGKELDYSIYDPPYTTPNTDTTRRCNGGRE